MKLPRTTAAVLALVMLCATLATAQTTAPARESTVKAAFLYKFGSFVDWPAGAFSGPDEPFVIGVAGDDAVAADLEQLARGLAVQGRPVQTRRVRDAQSAAGVHILFVGNMREGRLRDLLPPSPAPVLVVTEQDGALRLGSSINFSSEGGRIRFSASPAAAEARGLRLSSRLLDVAQTVEGRGR
jgi:hypothetical protein